MLPNFLIIGVPRGGTGWLYNNLRTHPEIFMPLQKEIHFFDRNYHQGIQYYEQFFKDVHQEKAIGEASPAYFHTAEVPERIYEDLGPNIKLIVSLRNPAERLYSSFWLTKDKYKSNRGLSFEEKLKQKPQYIEEGYYVDHINRYLRYFNKNQLLFLSFDDIKKNPEDLLKKIYAFLEVDTEHISPLLNFEINSAKSRPSIGKNPLIYYSYRVIKKLGLKQLAYKVEKFNKIEYPPMNPDTKKWLVKEMYQDKNRQLQDLIGIDNSHWNNIE